MKGEKLENIDKLVALAAGAWILIWLGYVAVDGEYCSVYSWRFYGVLLILPISIAGLAVLGRHWMTNDK